MYEVHGGHTYSDMKTMTFYSTAIATFPPFVI